MFSSAATVAPLATAAYALITAFLWMGLAKLWCYHNMSKYPDKTIPGPLYQEYKSA